MEASFVGSVYVIVQNITESSNNNFQINNEVFIGDGGFSPSVTNGAFQKTDLYGVIGKLGDRNALTETPTTTRIFNGQISEIIIFDRALMKDEIDDVEKYLSKKYSIELK